MAPSGTLIFSASESNKFTGARAHALWSIFDKSKLSTARAQIGSRRLIPCWLSEATDRMQPFESLICALLVVIIIICRRLRPLRSERARQRATDHWKCI